MVHVQRVLLLALLWGCVAVQADIFVSPPVFISQPVPCRCINTATGVYNSSIVNCTALAAADQACRYAFPAALRINATCVGGVWTMPENVRDVVVPEFTLLDFCNSIVSFRGNLYVPPSSNLTLFRVANDTVGTARGGQIRASGTIINQGWLLLVISNSSNRDVKQAPANGTIYADLLVATIPSTTPFAFQLSNRTQFWQAGFPGIKCQTLGQFPNITRAAAVGGATESRWSLRTTTFDQCVYDWTIFVGVVAGVGGAIILASIIYGIIFVILKVRKSMNTVATGPQYTQMERGDEDE